MTHIVTYIVIKLRYASKDNDCGVFDQPCQEKNCGVLGLILKDRLYSARMAVQGHVI